VWLSTKVWLIAALAGASLACGTSRDPAKGFRLASNGDPHRGKAALVEFGCNTCHEVRGSNLPRPKIQTVALGGSVMAVPSDGYLVTAIINPVYHAARYAATGVAPAGEPRMPEYASRMTVQQLTDIVAYLHSRYALHPMQVPNEYP
jgi:sulfur-oxidizing protein SoxX